MADPNLRDFYGRLDRIEKAHQRGYGFEAAGTLGRSHYGRGRRPGVGVVAPAVFVATAVILLKALIHHGIGAGVYDARVADLWQGQTALERIGAAVMQADPATLWLSDLIARLLV